MFIHIYYASIDVQINCHVAPNQKIQSGKDTLGGGKPRGEISKGNGVPGRDGPGRGGDEKYPDTQVATNTRFKHRASHEYGKPRLEMLSGGKAIGVAEEGRYGDQPNI